MKRYRLTTPPRQRELAKTIEDALVAFDRKVHALIHTYPHRAVATAISWRLVKLEHGKPRLLAQDGRRALLVEEVCMEHANFDHNNRWQDGYGKHAEAAAAIVDAIVAAEVEG